jgi:DHA1 family tetracycline resistance protein-like MFS transporter
LTQFVCAPLLGSLSDRYGRRPVILVSLLGLGIDYLIIAFASNLWWFAVGRAVAGIMVASYLAAGAYIADVSPPEKRAQNYGLIGAAFGAGFIAGPLIGGVLGGIDLRLPFLVAAVFSFLNLLFGVLFLPESLPADRRHSFKVAEANPVGALVAVSRRPALLGLIAVFALAALANRAAEVTWVLYTGHCYGWGTVQVGVSLAMVGVISIIGQGWLVRVVSRVSVNAAPLSLAW